MFRWRTTRNSLAWFYGIRMTTHRDQVCVVDNAHYRMRSSVDVTFVHVMHSDRILCWEYGKWRRGKVGIQAKHPGMLQQCFSEIRERIMMVFLYASWSKLSLGPLRCVTVAINVQSHSNLLGRPSYWALTLYYSAVRASWVVSAKGKLHFGIGKSIIDTHLQV